VGVIKNEMMNKGICIAFILFSFVLISLISCQNKEELAFDITEWNEIEVSPEELVNWKLLGEGQVFNIFNGQTCLMEADTTQGVMLMGPDYYGENVVVKYKALALTPASVFVTMLSTTDTTSEQTLTIPEEYDGSMGLLTQDIANYFFAFKNEPHGANPFIMKNPGSVQESSAAQSDGMVAGVYYDIEVGRIGEKVWLSIDGKKVVEMQDPQPLKGGHVIFRLRGTAGLKAACLIKEFKIYTK
jgi:hypothetical protein